MVILVIMLVAFAANVIGEAIAFAAALIIAADVIAVFVVVIVAVAAQPLFLGGMLGLFAQQRVAVGLGDLVVIGVDFREGEEAVAIAAVIDERRLQRRFDPRNLG